jgi:hypothetical protein
MSHIQDAHSRISKGLITTQYVDQEGYILLYPNIHPIYQNTNISFYAFRCWERYTSSELYLLDLTEPQGYLKSREPN